MPDRTYCCELAAHEPLAGTADPVDVWLMLEYRDTWKARAFEDNGLPPAVGEWVAGQVQDLRARGLKVRPQFIRQPDAERAELRLVVAHAGGMETRAALGYEGLINRPLSESIHATRPRSEPLYFVCTNGQRDLCCARFGLPAYERLRTRLGDRVWQTTHLGGHRFAPNVLVLPQGAVYGRVAPDAVSAFVDTIEGGGLAFDHLRGRSFYPPAVQAAEALLGRSDLCAPRVTEHEGRSTVTFGSPSGDIAVTVCAGEPIHVLASCGDAAPKPVVPWAACH